MPGIASGGTDTTSTLDAMANGAGGQQGRGSSSDQQRAQVEQAIMAIRELQQKADELGKSLPSVQQEVQQIRQLLRRMVIKAGQQAPGQSTSEASLPGGA